MKQNGVSPPSLSIDIKLIKCNCCSDFSTWKLTHGNEAKQLQSIADQPYYYKVCNVIVNGTEYSRTIRALPGSTNGECMKQACTAGDHPYAMLVTV